VSVYEDLEDLTDRELKLLIERDIPQILRERALVREGGAGMIEVDLAYVIEEAIGQIYEGGQALRAWLDKYGGRRIFVSINIEAVGAPIMTAEEAAKVLKVSSKTVTNLCAQGVIPAEKVGRAWRIKRQELMRYLSGQEVDENGQPAGVGATS
jgi:excisionase family DNA binding protein